MFTYYCVLVIGMGLGVILTKCVTTLLDILDENHRLKGIERAWSDEKRRADSLTGEVETLREKLRKEENINK